MKTRELCKKFEMANAMLGVHIAMENRPYLGELGVLYGQNAKDKSRLRAMLGDPVSDALQNANAEYWQAIEAEYQECFKQIPVKAAGKRVRERWASNESYQKFKDGIEPVTVKVCKYLQEFAEVVDAVVPGTGLGRVSNFEQLKLDRSKLDKIRETLDKVYGEHARVAAYELFRQYPKPEKVNGTNDSEAEEVEDNDEE